MPAGSAWGEHICLTACEESIGCLAPEMLLWMPRWFSQLPWCTALIKSVLLLPLAVFLYNLQPED